MPGVLVFALVAQWTEQQPSKLLVVGSNPARGACVVVLFQECQP